MDLFDVTFDERWAGQAPASLSAWFPWLNMGQVFPWMNTGPGKQLPHRMLRELEELNRFDMGIYERAL